MTLDLGVQDVHSRDGCLLDEMLDGLEDPKATVEFDPRCRAY